MLKKWFHMTLVFILTFSLLAPTVVHGEQQTATQELTDTVDGGLTNSVLTSTQQQAGNTTGDSAQVQNQIQASITIEGLEGTILETTHQTITEGTTALSLVKNTLSEKGIDFEVINSSWGEYLSSIAGVDAGRFGSWDGWMYSVNNVSPDVGLDHYELKDTDELVIYYSKYPVISVANELQASTVNPSVTVELVGDEFVEAAKNPESWKIETGDTSLTAKSIVLKTNQQAEISFEGTANPASISITALAPAVSSNTASEVVTIEVKGAPTLSEALAVANQSILEKNQAPKFGNEWGILALARSGYAVPEGYYETYYNNVVAKLEEKNGVLSANSYTEYSRLILALTAIDKDPSDVAGYNLLEKLADFNKVTKQGINGAIYALIALDTKAYEIPQIEGVEKVTTRQALIDFILSKEIDGGGFALSGANPDPDVTAMAIQSLAPYKEEQIQVKETINRAVSVLENLQLVSGGYSSWGENSMSSAQVLVALSTIGINGDTDERFQTANGSSVLSAIMEYYIDEGFKYKLTETTVNAAANQQVAYALAAYERYLNGNTPLYDMTDVGKETEVPSEQNPGNHTGDENEQNTDETTGNPKEQAPSENTNNQGGQTEKIAKLSIKSDSKTILSKKEVKIANGDTVYDVLKQITDQYGINLDVRTTEYGVYVEGIDGLYEFDRGPLSGWMYKVNGDFLSKSAADYKVKPGDVIEWVYTEDLGKDVGEDSNDNTTGKPSGGGSGGGGGGGSATTGSQQPAPSTNTGTDLVIDETTSSKDAPISIETNNGQISAKIDVATIKEQLQEKASKQVVLQYQNGSVIEIPKEAITSKTYNEGSALKVEVKQTGKQVTLNMHVESSAAVKEAFTTGKEYVKVTLPNENVQANVVVLALEEGEYKAVPHKVVNGEIVIFTKTSGEFVISSETVTFDDIQKVSYKEDIEFLASRHIVKGKETGAFEPNESITRAQFGAMISRALGLQATGEKTFEDTAGKWYEKDIQALYEAGITKGSSATTFNPEEKITRQQAAALMARVLDYVEYEANSLKDLNFPDRNNISKEHKEAVQLLYSLDIMSGKTDGTFDAAGNLTRGQMAKILRRTLNVSGLM